MKNLIGQQMIVGLQGTSLTEIEKKFIIENDIGGVILFTRNVESPEQLHALVTEIQGLRHKTKSQAPLLVSIDMEGGRVHRLKAPFTQWPSLRKMGDIDSTSIAFKFAQNMGDELRALGINLNFAPCVDVLTNPKNEVIGDRSISEDPEMVSKIASALVRGYIKSGVQPCAKHYPGHGNTLLDSHEALPVEDRSLEELRDRELVPFKKVFRARLNFLMTAHILYKKVDPEWPATLSATWINRILKQDFRYRQFVITDDLDMKALTNHYDKSVIPVQALQAGASILLYCHELDSPQLGLEAVIKAVENNSLPREVIQKNHDDLLAFKKEHLLPPYEPKPMSEVQSIVGHPDHIRLAKAIDTGDIPDEFRTT